uniref:Uncharacterized protein n=1 Tax=Globisporangium ultimum (strain ATCC 200006 / CBS 805.95 / DAOM BR144) TaxID=431595 RepID=K3WUV7_GLOUD
ASRFVCATPPPGREPGRHGQARHGLGLPPSRARQGVPLRHALPREPRAQEPRHRLRHYALALGLLAGKAGRPRRAGIGAPVGPRTRTRRPPRCEPRRAPRRQDPVRSLGDWRATFGRPGRGARGRGRRVNIHKSHYRAGDAQRGNKGEGGKTCRIPGNVHATMDHAATVTAAPGGDVYVSCLSPFSILPLHATQPNVSIQPLIHKNNKNR